MSAAPVGSPENYAMQLLKMYPQAFPGGMRDALAFVQKNGVGSTPNSTAAPPSGQPTGAIPAGQGAQAVPVTHTDPRSAPSVPGPTPPGPASNRPGLPQPTPPAGPVTVQPQRQFAGIQGDPGHEKFAADDQYGHGMRQNTNQAGVQSNGDDDPWSIGAFTGGTYDPVVMKSWTDRALKGDKVALNLLAQVGYTGQGGDQWAKDRGLTTREQGFAAGGKWYTAPQGQANPAGATRHDPTPVNDATARDTGSNLPPATADGWDPNAQAQGRNSVEHIDPDPATGASAAPPYSNAWADKIKDGLGDQGQGATDQGGAHGEVASAGAPPVDAAKVDENDPEYRNKDLGIKQWFR